MNSSTRLVVKAGACMIGGDGSICALKEEDCPPESTFVSPRQLDQSGGGLAHGGACTTRSGTEEDSHIGWCTNEGCTGDASACSNTNSFVANDDRCTLKVDSTEGTRDSLFGRCGADSTCYWSSLDCNDLSSWQPAYTDLDSGCTCEHVRVGACFDEDFYYCAVDKSSCDPGAQWIDAVSLQGTQNAPDCYLCREDPSPAQVPKDSPNLAPAPLPVENPQVSNPVPTSPLIPSITHSENSASKGKNQQAIVIGLTLGALGAGLLLTFVVVVWMRRCRGRGPRKSNKETSDIPLESPTVSQVNVGYSEDNMSDIEG